MAWTFYNSSGEALINDGGLSNVVEDTTPQVGGSAGFDLQAQLLVGNGGTTGIAISANGEVTMAAQPAFLASAAGDIGNITGDGTAYTMIFSTEVFDQNGDFDGTSTFTAPVDGRYWISAMTRTGGVSSSMNDGSFRITATSKTFELTWHAFNLIRGGGTGSIWNSVLVDMDAGDTVTIVLDIAGGGLAVDIGGGTAWFSGVLVV
jgi:hypothetical protein